MLRAAFICIFALVACSPRPEWKDASGQGRTFDKAAVDSKACMDAQTPPRTPNAPRVQQPKESSGLESCMALKGWQRVSIE